LEGPIVWPSYYPIQVGFVRKDIPEYPIAAVREGIVNAVTHRNYAIKSEVFIELKKDSLLIRNPGSFPPGTSPEDHLPVPRNPVLYELMYQCGLVERQGRGIDLIKEECENHPFVEYSYEIRPNYTILKFTRTKPFLNEEQKNVIKVLSTEELTSSEITHRLGISKATTVKRLNGLIDIGLVEKIGSGPSTRYRLKR
jgi:ATP-dependent DNA helicase RecG